MVSLSIKGIVWQSVFMIKLTGLHVSTSVQPESLLGVRICLKSCTHSLCIWV